MIVLIIYYQLRDLMKPCFKWYFLGTDLIQVVIFFQYSLTNINTSLFWKYDFLNLALCFTAFLYCLLTLSTPHYLVPGGCLVYFSKYWRPRRRCKIYLQMLTLIKNRNSWKSTSIFFVSVVNCVHFQ